MSLRSRGVPAKLVGAATCAVLLLSAAPAGAAQGDLGYDVSAPQCDDTLPTDNPDRFAVVGLNNGVATFPNPCLQQQVDWAAGLAQAPMLYVNTANRATTSTAYPQVSGSRDPVLCTNAADIGDAGCAYNYGWDLGGDALDDAATLTQGLAWAKNRVWWLDVESVNSWEGSTTANAAALQGFADRLRGAGVLDVGIYTNANDWQSLTGGYSRSTSASYRAAWRFTPRYPLEDGPLWFAGLNDLSDAQAKCGTTSYTGGEKLLSQYAFRADLDGDYRCADRDVTAPTTPMLSSPSGADATTVTTTSTTRVTWTAADSGTGLASWDLVRRVAPYNGSFDAWGVAASRVLTSASPTTASVASPARGATTCWRARARDVAGNTSALSSQRCVTTPLDDRNLAASSGWSRGSGSGWYGGTYSSTTRLGATLTRSGAQTSRLKLLAYRCPTCGSVRVYLNGTLFKTVSLASSTSGRAWFSLPRFSLRTTNVTLKVASSGKLVRVDALATSRL